MIGRAGERVKEGGKAEVEAEAEAEWLKEEASKKGNIYSIQRPQSQKNKDIQEPEIYKGGKRERRTVEG